MQKIILSATVAILVFFCGCRKNGGKPSANKKAFETAINNYCKSHSYGMKIKSFEGTMEKGNEASAMCKMEEAEGLYNMSVLWTFTMKKNKSGAWEVVSHKAK